MKFLPTLAGLTLALASTAACAQAFPSRPMRFIVPYPPGGGTDVMARAVGLKLAENTGQSVTIDNKPGAATQIGTDLAAKAPPDGYTFLLVSPSLVTNGALYDKLPYDAERDFEPVTLLSSVPLILVATPLIKAAKLGDLIQTAKSRPGKMSYAMATGSTPHLAGEWLKFMAGIDVQAVPYKGMQPAYIDLFTGRIDYLFDAIATALPHIKSGKVVPLGVSSLKRSQAAPDVPTLSESGLQGFSVDGWFGVVVPKGTPPDVIARLNTELLKALNDPATRTRVANAGFELIGQGPAEFGTFMKGENARWTKLIKQAGIKAE